MSANFSGVEFLRTTSIASRRPLPSKKEKQNREERERQRESLSPLFVLGDRASVHRLHIKGQEKNTNIFPSRPLQNVKCRRHAVTKKNVPTSVMHEHFFHVSAAVAVAVAVVVRLSSLKPEGK